MRALAVCTHGTSRSGGGGDSATIASAPRLTASAANLAPSVRCPGIATKTDPRATARESCVTPVTGVVSDPAAVTCASASDASARVEATSLPNVTDVPR